MLIFPVPSMMQLWLWWRVRLLCIDVHLSLQSSLQIGDLGRFLPTMLVCAVAVKPGTINSPDEMSLNRDMDEESLTV